MPKIASGSQKSCPTDGVHLNELISGFKRGVHSAKAGTTVDAPLTMQNHDAQQGELLLRNYVESLAEYHKRSIEPSAIEALTHGVSFPEKWLDSVDVYRTVFAEVTKKVDDSLEVETPLNVAYELRLQALDQSGIEETVEIDGSTASGNLPEPRRERFLDSEIIAIYW